MSPEATTALTPTSAHLIVGDEASGFHVSQPSLNALDGLHAVEKLLVGSSILNDHLGPPVDRQNQRVAALLEAVEDLRGVSFEITEGSNVVGNVQHGSSSNSHRI